MHTRQKRSGTTITQVTANKLLFLEQEIAANECLKLLLAVLSSLINTNCIVLLMFGKSS